MRVKHGTEARKETCLRFMALRAALRGYPPAGLNNCGGGATHREVAATSVVRSAHDRSKPPAFMC